MAKSKKIPRWKKLVKKINASIREERLAKEKVNTFFEKLQKLQKKCSHEKIAIKENRNGHSLTSCVSCGAGQVQYATGPYPKTTKGWITTLENC